MCMTCGCGGDGETTIGEAETGHLPPRHAHDSYHDHGHAHDHGHHSGDHESGGRRVSLEADILAKNARLAGINRDQFIQQSILCLNLLSSPGSGKTTLLVETIRALKNEVTIQVIEGDQASELDADRIRETGVRALQINTGKGCHLDAHMIAHAVERIDPAPGSLLLVENVGNLVCPALFDLGEGARVVLLSVTEGEDKPLKYPHMFLGADLVLLNKIDLLPYLRFDMGKLRESLERVRPKGAILSVSAQTGEGMETWLGWIRDRLLSGPALLAL